MPLPALTDSLSSFGSSLAALSAASIDLSETVKGVHSDSSPGSYGDYQAAIYTFG